jgi:hypothetical protein
MAAVRGSPFDRLRKFTMRDEGVAERTTAALKTILPTPHPLMVSFFTVSLSNGEPRTAAM